jgi:hypothetical protein
MLSETPCSPLPLWRKYKAVKRIFSNKTNFPISTGALFVKVLGGRAELRQAVEREGFFSSLQDDFLACRNGIYVL